MYNNSQLLAAIIIVNYNSMELTAKCAQNLDTSNNTLPIVVVDNQSSDQSYKYLRETFNNSKNVHIILSPKNGGYSSGNNFGIRWIQKEYGSPCFYIIMNPDVIVSVETIQYLCQRASKYSDIAMIAPVMLLNGMFNTDSLPWQIPSNKELVTHFRKWTKTKSLHNYKYIGDDLVETETLPGSFFVVKSTIFEDIGLFDENVFLYNEENILGIKLREKGYRCALDISKHYYHNHLDNDKKSIQYRYKHCYSNIINNYNSGFQSRIYLCEKYYNNNGKSRILIIDKINRLLIYVKHLCACIICKE